MTKFTGLARSHALVQIQDKARSAAHLSAHDPASKQMDTNTRIKLDGMKPDGMKLDGMKPDGLMLANLWAGAMTVSPHFAGCACSGGFCIPFNPADLEQDMLAFLSEKYRAAKQDALLQFVQARSDDKRSAFGTWLEAIDTSPLSSKDRQRLMGDLYQTLESMNGMARGRDNIVCY